MTSSALFHLLIICPCVTFFSVSVLLKPAFSSRGLSSQPVCIGFTLSDSFSLFPLITSCQALTFYVRDNFPLIESICCFVSFCSLPSHILSALIICEEPPPWIRSCFDPIVVFLHNTYVYAMFSRILYWF